MKMTRDLIIVSTYIYNKKTEEILRECLDCLKKTGKDLFIMSNSILEKETLEKANSYLYFSKSPFFEDKYDNIPVYDFWFGCDGFEVHHFIPSYQRYGLAVLYNLFNSLETAKSMGYESFYLVVGDNYFGDDSIEFIKKMSDLCEEQGKKSFFYVSEGVDVSTAIIYSNIDFFLENFPNIKKEEDYRKYLLDNQGNLDFLDVEKLLYKAICRIDENQIIKKPESTLLQDFSDAKFNLVSGVYNTSLKYKGFLTSVFNCFGVNGENLGMCVFSRNLREKKAERRIEVIIDEGRSLTINHSTEVYGWQYDIFEKIDKIRVFEDDILIFEESGNTNSYFLLK